MRPTTPLPRVLRAMMSAAALLGAPLVAARAQQPTPPTGQGGIPGLPNAQTVPPEVARQMLQNRPDLAAQLRQRIAESGLTPDQIRARLRAAGYPENFLDDYLIGADTTRVVKPSSGMLEAAQMLGVVSAEALDSLKVLTDSAQAIADSLRRDSLEVESKELEVFGLNVFRRATTQFRAPLDAPVGKDYLLGPGDVLVLILSGEVEEARQLEITREGFLVLPQVGPVYAANMTLGQLEDQLYARLGRVYSGLRRGPDARTRFQLSVARVRTIQVYVLGDVARPGAYQVSAASGPAGAIYAAGGPTAKGSFRTIEVRRADSLLGTVDLYDYLASGIIPPRIAMGSGDVVFVRPRGSQVKVTGEVIRPGIYEVKADETLRDLIATAGGFDATAQQNRVQIFRVLPAGERGEDGRDRVVVEVSAPPTADGLPPAVPVRAGDSVVVFSVRERLRSRVLVRGNVWIPGPVGFTPGMRLSEALRLAGGPKPDVYVGPGGILVTRLHGDSTRSALRSAFRDTTGAVTDDLELQEDDEITAFSRARFRSERYVVVTGAVRRPGRLPYRQGMTMRDALLLANGLREDALLTEAEIASIPENRQPGELAVTRRVPLDSSYVFDRDASGRYLGPPGLPAPRAGAPEVELKPYDNVLILRQPDFELPRRVAVLGEVKYPGNYTLRSKSDRLLDVLQRAGGLTNEAYPAGIEFHRQQGRQGRIGIDLPRILRDSTYRDNIILLAGDSIVIPEYSPVVQVGGAVNSPVAVSFVPGRSVDYYIEAAGGFTAKADKGRSYVQQPNGKVESGRSRKPQPGARVFVPEKEKKEGGLPPAVVATTVASILATLSTVVVVALTQ